MVEVGRDLCLLKIFITHFLRLKQVVFSELGQRLSGFVVILRVLTQLHLCTMLMRRDKVAFSLGNITEQVEGY